MTSAARSKPFLLLAVAVVASACGGAAAASTAALSSAAAASTATLSNAAASGPSASARVAGCVPECLPQAGTGARTVAAGSYTTHNFFAGSLMVTLDAGWTAEDGQNELLFEHPGPPDWFIFVWLDPYPVAHLQRVPGFQRTPAALIAWLRGNPTLITSPVPATTVGDAIPALAIDLRVSDQAIKEAADCPDLCTNYLGFENGPNAHGIARPGVARTYFAPVTYGGQAHLLTLSYEADDPATFAAGLAHAKQIIDTIRMPVVAAAP